MKVEGVHFRKGEFVILGRGKAIYRCSTCASAFTWDALCRWYGSIRDNENGNYRKLKFYCSQACVPQATKGPKP